VGAWKDELMRIQQQKQEEAEFRKFDYGDRYYLQKKWGYWKPFFKIIPEKGILFFEPAGLMYENSNGEVRLDDLEKYLDLSVCEYPVEFVEEPDNYYDANAIKIYAIHQLGLKFEVGYVPKNPYTDYHCQFNEWFAENRQYFKSFYFYYDKDFKNYFIKGELEDEHKSDAEKIFSAYESVIKKDLEEKRKQEEAETIEFKSEAGREVEEKVKSANKKRKREESPPFYFSFRTVLWIVFWMLIVFCFVSEPILYQFLVLYYRGLLW